MNTNEEDFIPLITLSPEWEQAFAESLVGTGEDRQLSMPPTRLQEFISALRNAFDNSRDDFYDDIGGQDVYACGWDDQLNRGQYEGLRDDADGLFRSARYAVTLAFLNHVVSAIDAAKSASNRRKVRDREYSWDWDVTPTPRGDLAVRVELFRRF